MKFALPVFSDERFRNYFNAMEALGAECELVGSDCAPEDYEGLLLPGGGDVNPARYGRAMEPLCNPPDDALDEMQLTVLDHFVKAGKPVLGTCRGHQIINVYFGGTLVQHLPQSPRHRRDPGASTDKAHPSRAAEGSFLARLYGTDFTVNSAHHQAVEIPGKDIEVVQWSDDGVVEAFHHTKLPVYGVQWHPERMCFANRRMDTVDGAELFQWFIDQCKA